MKRISSIISSPILPPTIIPARSHTRAWLSTATRSSVLKSAANVSTKKYLQSNESLIKRILKKKEVGRSISPVVDFYNSISIQHAVTAGAFGLPELRAANALLELRIANAKQDGFIPLGAPADAQPGKVDKEEILYAQGNTVLTRHMAWRQCKQALMTDESIEAMFMSEVSNEGEVGTSPPALSEYR